MKTLTIGRSSECDISIEHEQISRKHALLKLHRTGKIEIVDISQNGTSVNGSRLQQNVTRQIHRNDVVTFAGAKHLNWNQVPDLSRPYKIGALAMLALLLIGFVFWYFAPSANNQETAQTDEYTISTSDGSSTQGTQAMSSEKEDNNILSKFLNIISPKTKPKHHSHPETTKHESETSKEDVAPAHVEKENDNKKQQKNDDRDDGSNLPFFM